MLDSKCHELLPKKLKLEQIKEILEREYRTKQQFLWVFISLHTLALWSREDLFPFWPLTQNVKNQHIWCADGMRPPWLPTLIKDATEHWLLQLRTSCFPLGTSHTQSEQASYPYFTCERNLFLWANGSVLSSSECFWARDWRLKPPQCRFIEIYEDINTPSKWQHQKLSNLKHQGPRLILVHQRLLLTS